METLKRTLSGAFFVPLVYVALMNNYYHTLIFFVGIVIIGLCLYVETRILFCKAGAFHTWSVPIALVSIYCSFFFKQYSYLGAIIIFVLLIECAFWLKTESNFQQAFHNILSSLFLLIYLGFMWGSLIVIRQYSSFEGVVSFHTEIMDGAKHIMLILTGTWMCDIGAYFGGRSLGRTKLNLPISPNKTLEGFISGILLSGISLYFVASYIQISFHILMLIIPFATILGDLFESLIKRVANQKDSSHFIPGHGGFLDVFDALIFTAPVYYFIIFPWVVG